MKRGYKQSEVGVIPEEWEVRKIDSLCGTITTGKLDANAMRPDGPYRFYTCAKDFYQIDKFAFDCEALLISGNGAHVGYIHYYQGKFNAYQRTYVLFGFRDDIKFIEHYLSDNFKKRIEVEVKAGGTPYITRPTIAETALPIPPLPEQRAIAEALSDVDGLLGGLDRLIAKKRDLKQAAMQQLLTGQTRLPGFHGEWEVKRLKAIVQTPVTDGPHLTPQFFDDGIPFLSVNNLVGNRIDLKDLRFISQQDHELFSRKCKPRKDDILLGKAASVGKVAIVELDCEFNIWSPIALVRVSSDHAARFIYYQLQSADLTGQITLLTNSSSQGNIGMGDIEKLTLKLPPLPEQTAIATILSDMDADLTALEQRREKTRALKQAMMQELLTGKTRLL
jgi:type I restriction enzyme S subunit